MPVAARVFTIEEVDAMIPELNRLVGEQLELKTRMERLLSDLVEESGEMPDDLSATETDSEEARKIKQQLSELAVSYNDGWGRVQSLGAVIKDQQIGLLDFYGRIDGRLVWLCWRFGEERLGFYHELDAGFAGRRELRSETRSKLMN